MSFGPSSQTKSAENSLAGSANALQNTVYPQLSAAGGDLLHAGTRTIQPGVNYFQNLLSGNTANTTAALQPDIDRIHAMHAQALKAISTLTPRGGGRSGTLFSQQFAPQSDISSLFNGARTTAAGALPGIGMSEIGAGTNLFGLGTQALTGAGNANANLAQLAQKDQQSKLAGYMGLGQGLFGLATTPFGGGSSANGLLGLLGGK